MSPGSEEEIKCVFDDNSGIILLIFIKIYVVGASNEHPQFRFLEDLTKIIFQLSSNFIKNAPYIFFRINSQYVLRSDEHFKIPQVY